MKIEFNENTKWQGSMTIKIILLAVMGLFILIPLELIKSIIMERQSNYENVKREIAAQWAGKQSLSGPILNIPVRITPSAKDAEPHISVLHLMPETLNVTGEITTEERHKSIYRTVVYNSSVRLAGEFILPPIVIGEKNEILWQDAYYTLGISDNRGIRGTVFLKSGESSIDAVPGIEDTDVFPTGITFPAGLKGSEKTLPYEINLALSGSEGLSFSPVGKTTKVDIKSTWNAPGFIGDFLPATRNITESGFNASWLVTNLNRNFPQVWRGKEYEPLKDSFGVDFVMVVDHYQKSYRSAKYGILFIALTFLALIFAELTGKKPLQILNYLLVSLALILFFSLLNALSEHIGFNPAYLVASASTIALITVFLKMIVGKLRPVMVIFGMLVFLYAFIYVLLSLNDYAYLAGNIGLFFLLAVTMIVSARLRLFSHSSPKSDI
jgi:inner membrane protein